MRHLARFAGLTIVVPVFLAAACASTTVTGSESHRDLPGTPIAKAASQTSAPVRPSTGTQLQAALVTDVPAGFTLDKSATVDTGTSLQDEENGPGKTKSHCSDLDATSWLAVAGMTGVSFAESDYLDRHDQEIAQEIDSFDTPADATQTMAQLKTFMAKCATFTSESIRYHMKWAPIGGLGAGAIEAVITSPSIDGGVVEVASQHGDNVVTALYSARKLSQADKVGVLVKQIESNFAKS